MGQREVSRKLSSRDIDTCYIFYDRYTKYKGIIEESDKLDITDILISVKMLYKGYKVPSINVAPKAHLLPTVLPMINKEKLQIYIDYFDNSECNPES
jgi:hypothetical protein